MQEHDRHLSRIQQQFRRQADAYERLASVTDEKGLDALVSLSRVREGERVLDVACGPGFLTTAFAKRCRRAVGVDATDTFLAHAAAEASRRGCDNLDLVLGDATRLPFPDGVFDVAACRAAFHHFPEIGPVVTEIVRVTTREARLVVADQVASEDAEKAEFHNRIERLCDPTHVRALPESELEALFAAHGLSIAFKGRSKIDYSLAEWLSHGGPSPENAREIERLMRWSMDGDRSGLNVRIEAGELRFSHTAVAFVLEKSAVGL